MATTGRRGRRQTICAPSIVLEEGWKPKVVPKSDEQKERIDAVISANILFSGLDREQRNILIGAMEEKVFDADAVIIKQGEIGDFFYVLEEGHCDIFVEGVGKVMDVSPGGSFGELALMYNAPRAATVIATKPVRTWAVDQITFKKTMMDSTIRRRNRHEGWITKTPILSTLNHYERLTIAYALKPRSFSAGEVIIGEGDEGEDFYFIEEGEVRCTKDGVAEEVSRRLTQGDYFGERALITNEPRAATVTAVTAVTCQVLDRRTFKRLLGPLEDIMIKNMEVYNRYKDTIQTAPTDEPLESDDEDDDDVAATPTAGGGGDDA